MASPTEITVAQLARLVGTPDAPVLLDVRTDEDFADDPRLLPAARRHAFDDVRTIASAPIHDRVIVYCQKGRKISQGAAALLRASGVRAETLEGGQFAWRDAGAPLVDASALPPASADGGTLWVTRHRPKIDRIACPWLLRRFVDARARFLFVAPSEVAAVAERFDATPFDVEGTRSRMHRDDLAQLEAGMALYDAFYRWARDASAEGHDWPAPDGAKRRPA